MMKSVVQVKDLPHLPGYITARQAARILGVTHTAVLDFVRAEKLRLAFRLGDDDYDKPRVVLVREEVEQLKTTRTTPPPVSYKDALNAWNKRVKAWGLTTGWPGRIVTSGRPRLDLIEAYLRANGDDPMPVQSAAD